MKNDMKEFNVTFRFTPQSFNAVLRALRIAIKNIKEEESRFEHKPCYSSPLPHLYKLLQMFEDIYENIFKKK